MKNSYNNKLHSNTLDNLIEGFQLISFDWRYLYVNNSVVKQSKYLIKEDLIGYTMTDKYPGIENTEMFKVLQQCMNDRISRNIENEFTFPDNSKGWFELRIEPVPEGLFILSIDITERKKLELEKKEYIGSLEEMLFMTSHEVRQPVANCLGLMSVIDTQEPTKEDLAKIISHVKESATRLDAFTKKLTIFIHEVKQKSENTNLD